MVAPCKDCPDRHPHCHSECGRYKEYANWCESERKRKYAIVSAKYFSEETLRVMRKRAYRKKHI